MNYFQEDHQNRLPTVRLHKAVLRDFKSVRYGKIEMDCSKHFIPYGTTSDMLGIYGQNGSGKTAFIEALAILKALLSGDRVSFLYADCIATGADHAELEFTFDLQYPTEPVTIRKVVYSFCLAVRDITGSGTAEHDMTAALDGLFSQQITRRRVRVYNEVIRVGGMVSGESLKLTTVLDTGTDKAAFGPRSKQKLFYPVCQENDVRLLVNRQLADERSMSFIFMDETLQLFGKTEQRSAFHEILLELNYFGRYFLAVVDTKSMAAIRSNIILPLFTLRTRETMMINTVGMNIVSEQMLEAMHKVITPISKVLPHFVPGMTIALEELGPAMLDDGRQGKSVELVVCRGDRKLPIRCESDGVRKIISVMSLIIDAYNSRSTTIAIDELDAGIFEYLLGELLDVFRKFGQGQLIFTSHNLRPLEVMDRRFIRFTTTNPDNRYILLKSSGEYGNLRNQYFREILFNEQGEELYNKTMQYKIVTAMGKADN